MIVKLSVEAIAMYSYALSNKRDVFDLPLLGKERAMPETGSIYIAGQYRSKWNFFEAYSSFDTV